MHGSTAEGFSVDKSSIAGALLNDTESEWAESDL